MAACPDNPGNNFETYLSLTNPLCTLGTAGKLTFGGIWQSYLDDMSEGLTKVLKTLATLFLLVPDPDLGDGVGNNSDIVNFLQGSTGWYVGAFLVLSLIASGARIVITRQSKDVIETFKVIGRVIVAVSIATPMVILTLQAGDAYSSWVIERSTAGSVGFGERIIGLFTAGGDGLGSGLLTLLGLLLAAIIALFQVFVMLIRGAALILLTSTLAVPAAISGLETGSEWWRRQIAWIVGWLLFKPVAATIYAASFRLLSPPAEGSASEDSLLPFTYGLALLFLAAWSLPSIVKLVSPPSGSSGGGGSGGAAFIGLAATATGAGKLATGAAAAARSR